MNPSNNIIIKHLAGFNPPILCACRTYIMKRFCHCVVITGCSLRSSWSRQCWCGWLDLYMLTRSLQLKQQLKWMGCQRQRTPCSILPRHFLIIQDIWLFAQRRSKAQDQMSAFQIAKIQFDISSDFKHDLRLVENISY